MYSHVIATGSYLPHKILTNSELEQKLDTSDEWIRSRTGICQRHIAAENEFTSDLAANAALDALQNANMRAEDIDLLIVATTTPDRSFPATATYVQNKIGAMGAAFDMQAACSGFVYGLAIADGMLRTGQANHAMVIGAETYSRIVDWQDRSTCILFGDGAGAVILQASDIAQRGILANYLQADGQFADMLVTTGGISTTQTAGVVMMQGKEVFRHAVAKMGEALLAAAKQAKISVEDIDWIIPHQANIRIIQTMAEKLNADMDKIIITTDKHANTSAASIPLAWHSAVLDGKIKNGNLLALPALGAGLTWGCCIIKL